MYKDKPFHIWKPLDLQTYQENIKWKERKKT